MLYVLLICFCSSVRRVSFEAAIKVKGIGNVTFMPQFLTREALHSRTCFSHWFWPTSFSFFGSNTRLCHRWSARPTGSWIQTIHWQLIPTLRLQLRQRWKWSTRPSMCHTPATPLLHVHLSLPLFPTLPLYLSLSLSLSFCYAVDLWQPPPPAVILLLPSYLPSDCVGFWSLLLPVSMLFSQLDF